MKKTTKTFIYIVNEFTFTDTEAFGEAWLKAKEKAAELHCAVYRKAIIETYEERDEVYFKAGMFGDTEYALKNPDNVKIF